MIPVDAATLEFVNGLRGQFGAEPLTELCLGKECSANDCPVARSLPGTALVDEQRITIYEDGEVRPTVDIDTPPQVAAFIRAFDGGRWPEYEAL